jgi:hypothetical protein
MPPTLHALLRGLAGVTGFVAGALVGAGVYTVLASSLVGGLGVDPDWPPVLASRMIAAAVLCFGGGFLGLKLGAGLVARYVPARCRACGGRSYPYRGEEVGRQVAYRCRACSRVSLTPFYEGHGS